MHKILVEELLMNRYQHEVAVIILPWGRKICSLQSVTYKTDISPRRIYMKLPNYFFWHLIVASHYQFIHHLSYSVQFTESTFYILLSPNWAECILPNQTLSLREGLNCSFESPSLLFLSMSSLKTMKYKQVYYSWIHALIKYLLHLFILISLPLNL